MRLVLLSDTHNHNERIVVPGGDVLVHAGDLTMWGSPEEMKRATDWLRSLPHPRKVVIAGNHDFCLETRPRPMHLMAGIDYLEDSGITIDGIKFWGAPWVPDLVRWAFGRPRGSEYLRNRWAQIPEGTDVLITHGPPWGRFDRVVRGQNVGCHLLAERVAVVQPRLHVFGHIHEDVGVSLNPEGTRFVNACTCDERYRPVNPPVVVDL